jgi:hypothetical protein
MITTNTFNQVHSNLPLPNTMGMESYLVDIRNVVIPNVSANSQASAPWLNSSRVFMPLEQTIDMLIAEHLANAAQLRRSIQVAYVQGLWPNHLSADKLRMTQLTGLEKLAQHSALPVLQAAHHQFVEAAALAATFARDGNVEEAYKVLFGTFDDASARLVSLLSNVVPSVRMTRQRLEKSLALA